MSAAADKVAKEWVAEAAAIRAKREESDAEKLQEATSWESTATIAASLSTSLDRATDELNAALTEAEAALTTLNLGVKAWIDLSDEEGWSERLEFGKQGQKWQLLYSAGPADDPDNFRWDTVPLRTASRAARIKAASKLAVLLAALLKEAEKQVVDVKNRTAEVRAFAFQLRQRGTGK